MFQCGKLEETNHPEQKMWLSSPQILGDRRYYEEQTQTFGEFGIVG